MVILLHFVLVSTNKFNNSYVVEPYSMGDTDIRSLYFKTEQMFSLKTT